MELNDLFRKKTIDPRQVLVLRHRPSEPEFFKVFPWLAAERPDLFNAYQQTQGDKLGKAMRGAAYVASFIGQARGKALFVAMYSIGESRTLTRDEYWQVPEHIEMSKLGMKGFTGEGGQSSVLLFKLVPTKFYEEWKGKLVVEWPPPERSWWRRADRNTFRVLAILEESALVPPVKDWTDMVFQWEELRVLPSRLRSELSRWRAIYYIFDTSDRKGYVGSAYGDTNLLGRWEDYAASGHGGNALLRKRDPRHFRFSILQLVPPDMDAEEVIRLESSWKDRLHTRALYGLNDN